MDTETALNRSHGDPVRLTRKSPRVQIYDRLRLINDVWKSDKAFMGLHESEVYKVEAEQLVRMSKCCILDGDRIDAMSFLARWRSLPIRRRAILPWLLHSLFWLPGSGQFLNLVLRLKRRILSMAR